MKYVPGIDAFQGSLPRKCVLTIGNFDGLHLGHRDILDRIKSHAKNIAGSACVLTFNPHPKQALNPKLPPFLLNSYLEKRELLDAAGVDYMIEEPFSREFSNTSAQDFVENYLIARLGVRALYLGFNFQFGKGRSGSVEMLKDLAKKSGLEVHIVEPAQYKGENISSSRARKFLEQGEIESLNTSLGREYFVSGLVVKGVARGKELGFPTANLKMERRILPKLGVYRTTTHLGDQLYTSITNVGINPTFNAEKANNQATIETHIFEFAKDIYGEQIRVNFHEFIREEKKFSSKEALVEQIKLDIQKAKAKS